MSYQWELLVWYLMVQQTRGCSPLLTSVIFKHIKGIIINQGAASENVDAFKMGENVLNNIEQQGLDNFHNL